MAIDRWRDVATDIQLWMGVARLGDVDITLGGTSTMKAFVCLHALAAGLAFAAAGSSAADCYTGYDSTECLKQKSQLQRQLDELYSLEERALLERLKSYDEDFKNEAIRSLREANAAFANYKDAECYSTFLRDGMSLKDSAVLSDQCHVEWRAQRVAELKNRGQKARK